MCVECLFRLRVLRTSYVICVACLFRLIALKLDELCYMCSVLVSKHGFKNELCHMCGVLDSTFRLMLRVKRASLESKNKLCYKCRMLFLTHGTTKLPEILSDCFQPSSQSIVYTSGFIL